MKPVLALLFTAALAMASPVMAEGSGHPNSGEGDVEAAAKPKPVRKAKPKAKPSIPAPKIPDAPIPYTSLSAGTPLSADMAKALTPAPESHAPASVAHTEPTTAPLAAAPVHVAEVPPPPPPPRPREDVVEINPPPPAEINLKCETTITRGKKTVSTGIFYIAIVPSPIFPDEEASFQFRFVDPAHKSLVRDTVCQDISCQARVSPSTYSLINMTTKHGDALRITLDRARGGFYAEAIDDKMVGSTSHLGEQGWCAPEPKVTKALF
ncbi:hypothetical protein ABAC460_07640 [Asticcacaulis sp. AC460]|uniref:hypothetical protein n=1 Tax=Asticcacaulis sp. AC460 TaxID=1282360 RepID=UPI0003C3EF31|nr:hypothetical protein [Asticcacaulis sp. AC460]ESQ90941.1 hypothetical protein ABAC460_07640 [Asticcacaulis sp. AC460]